MAIGGSFQAVFSGDIILSSDTPVLFEEYTSGMLAVNRRRAEQERAETPADSWEQLVLDEYPWLTREYIRSLFKKHRPKRREMQIPKTAPMWTTARFPREIPSLRQRTWQQPQLMKFKPIETPGLGRMLTSTCTFMCKIAHGSTARRVTRAAMRSHGARMLERGSCTVFHLPNIRSSARTCSPDSSARSWIITSIPT